MGLFGGDYDVLGDSSSSSSLRFRKRQVYWLVGLVVLIACVLGLILGLALGLSLNRDDDDDDSLSSTALRDSVKLADLMTTFRSLQAIAGEYNGSRSIIYGYNASVDFVQSELEQAGYKPVRDPFNIRYARSTAPPTLTQLEPKIVNYTVDVDFRPFRNSPAGVIEGNFTYIDNYGCDNASYASFDAPGMVLVSRGGDASCTLLYKAQLAQAFGATAVLIHAEETAPALFGGSIPAGDLSVSIPAVTITFALGDILQCAQAAGSPVVRLTVSNTFETQYSMNIYADTEHGDPDNMVVIGSHLDSVDAGPGMNDNGSGSTLNLRLALEFAKLKIKPHNKVRFVWWGAEELGLLGARAYVDEQIAQKVLNKTAVYLNFDMVASPNYQIGVYDGADPTAPAGSAKVATMFNEYFKSQNLNTTPSPFNGRSDYGPFIAAGVPAGGLAAGAEGIKSMGDREAFGGMANTPYDPCYHLVCDTIENVNQDAVLSFTQAAGSILQQLAMKSDVRGFLGSDNKIAISTMADRIRDMPLVGAHESH
eukprot:TRINITY_DN2485_c0_g1_i1.p1 TRINITY_DN2485_c0_g1~~TRINITY_DN2485_c0_g1_i1.p1  ORF type:complete len:536 (-),score=91.35 TRINITY_DN2485_c0_g1_i1:65-1672(-)